MENEALFFEFKKGKFKRLAMKCRSVYFWWHGWILATILSILMGIGCLSYLVWLYQSGNFALIVSNQYIKIIAAITVAISIFFILAAYIFRKEANRVYGMPYSYMQGPVLYITEDEIGLEYHNRYDKKHKSSTDVVRVKLNKLNKICFVTKADLYIVYGSVEFIQYDDIETDSIRRSYTKEQFGKNASFSFFDCIKNEPAFIKYLEEKNIEIEVADIKKRKQIKELYNVINSQNWIYIS